MEPVLQPVIEPTATLEKQTKCCDNCGTPASGKFCVECGQEHNPSRVHFTDFIREYAGMFVDVDSKTFKSIRFLALRPGILSANYYEGKRASFVKPLDLYLLMSVIFFFFVSKFDPVTLESVEGMISKTDVEAIYATKKYTAEELDGVFQEKVHDNLPTLLLTIVPVLALFLALIYIRNKNYFFVHHLTFSYHFFSFFFLIFIPGLLIEDLAIFSFFGWLGYLFIAMKRTYQQDYVRTGVKAFTTWILVILLIYLYMTISANYSIGQIKNDLGI